LLNEVITNNYSDEKTILQNITIFGIQNEPKNIQVNGATYSNFYYNTTEEVSTITFCSNKLISIFITVKLLLFLSVFIKTFS